MDKGEIARKRAKKWYWEHRDKVLKKRRDYRATITPRQQKEITKKWKLWYAKNKDSERKRRKKYRENHKEQFKLYYLRYSLKNPNDRVARLFRHRIRQALKSQDLVKNESLEKYLGTSVKEAREYIELRFLKGMTWSNLGEWHIDHIIPIKNFDLSKESDLKKAFHFTNLQPLWAVDNLRKGSRLEIK